MPHMNNKQKTTKYTCIKGSQFKSVQQHTGKVTRLQAESGPLPPPVTRLQAVPVIHTNECPCGTGIQTLEHILQGVRHQRSQRKCRSCRRSYRSAEVPELDVCVGIVSKAKKDCSRRPHHCNNDMSTAAWERRTKKKKKACSSNVLSKIETFKRCCSITDTTFSLGLAEYRWRKPRGLSRCRVEAGGNRTAGLVSVAPRLLHWTTAVRSRRLAHPHNPWALTALAVRNVGQEVSHNMR